MASIAYRPLINEVLAPGHTADDDVECLDPCGSGQGYTSRQHPVDHRLYPKHCNLTCGIVQIIAGLACVVVGGMLCTSIPTIGAAISGIWAGIFAIIGGSLSIAAGMQKTKRLIITTLVMTTLTAVFAGSALDFSLGTTSVTSTAISSKENPAKYDQKSYGTGYSGYSGYRIGYGSSSAEVDPLHGEAKHLMICSILLLVFSLIAMVSAVWASGIACRFTCCCKCCRDCCCACYNNGEAFDGRVMMMQTGAESCAQVIGQGMQYPVAHHGQVIVPYHGHHQIHPPMYQHGGINQLPQAGAVQVVITDGTK